MSTHQADTFARLISDTVGHFTVRISLSLRPKTETKPLNFGLSPEFRLTNHCNAHHCSVHNVIADVIADISVVLCLFMNKWKSEVIFVHLNLILTDQPISFMQNQPVS